MRNLRGALHLVMGLAPLIIGTSPVHPPVAVGGQIDVLGRDGSTINRLTDGDTVSLRVILPEQAGAAMPLELVLDGDHSPVASCTIPSGETTCETAPLSALGWYWHASGDPSTQRVIQAMATAGTIPVAQTSIAVASRPVVMVHGFSSSWEAWVKYLGPTGYLREAGLAGFAVGDGQVAGTMNTGNFAKPTARTNTIAENAAILGEYISRVKETTGAQTVDLIAHSMGGLISRAYIDRVMTTRDVAQLIMLGSPMSGTDCADLPASLGLYLPATLEIRPSYVRSIFNPQVSHRHGVPFHALAGVPIVESFKSPCTDVPTDLAVSLQSVTAIAVHSKQMSVLHMELNLSSQVFDEYVKPLLQTPAGGVPAEPDPQALPLDSENLQFSRLFTGHVDAGSGTEMIIPIDPGIAVASFALYDTTRSLQVSVSGASGNTIELNATKNGLIVVHDPEALIYLGYGFKDPKPGAWRVRLQASAATPAEGADFALTARFVGGTQLVTNLSTLLPATGEELLLTATMLLGSEDVPLREVDASVRRPDGTTEHVALTVKGSQAQTTLQPRLAGLYGIDLTAIGVAADGAPIERSAFLAFEAQSEPSRELPIAAWVGAGLSLTILAAVVVLMIRRRREGARRFQVS